MMVGPSGSGKSMAWRVLLKALERLEGVEGVAHIIDPKAISKDHLYGTLPEGSTGGAELGQAQVIASWRIQSCRGQATA